MVPKPFQYHDLHICGSKDRKKIPNDAIVVNTTSRSKDFGKAFSPFINQGWLRYKGLSSKNVENYWQFSKMYEEHIDDFKSWIDWRSKGLLDGFAHRYPMGKEKRSVCHYLGRKMDKVEARKKIYGPVYYQKLYKYCEREINSLIDMLTVCDVWLWDFDSCITDKSFQELINDLDGKMGHACYLKKYICNMIEKEW